METGGFSSFLPIHLLHNYTTNDKCLLSVHTHPHTCPHHPHTQSQYSYAGPAPKFFEECETYWAPSSQANELYEQLAARKYREILREQIQYEEILLASII